MSLRPLEPLVSLLLRLLPLARRRQLGFAWRYRSGQVPWDTNETPPEVVEFISHVTPGKALDLGCGTGTNVLYLAARGWEATGVDYVARAIRQAQEKASQSGFRAVFLPGDVTRLDDLPLVGPYDFVLDIGCMHSLDTPGQQRYASHVSRLTRSGGCYMLYAGLPHRGSFGELGLTPERVRELFTPAFHVTRQELGEDSQSGWRRAWYWMERVARDGEA
jgi:SAM-dependent methyltransferase